MVTMNDIIALVEKAMELNLCISTTYREMDDITTYAITIYKNEDKPLVIEYTSIKGKHTLAISANFLNWVEIKDLSELDIANFRVLALKAKEYSENKVLEYFNSFFDESDVIDIDKED